MTIRELFDLTEKADPKMLDVEIYVNYGMSGMANISLTLDDFRAIKVKDDKYHRGKWYFTEATLGDEMDGNVADAICLDFKTTENNVLPVVTGEFRYDIVENDGYNLFEPTFVPDEKGDISIVNPRLPRLGVALIDKLTSSKNLIQLNEMVDAAVLNGAAIVVPEK